MSQTIAATAQVGAINPFTGHMTTEEDVALFRAVGPDRADPPEPFPGRGFPIRTPGGGGPGGGVSRVDLSRLLTDYHWDRPRFFLLIPHH